MGITSFLYMGVFYVFFLSVEMVRYVSWIGEGVRGGDMGVWVGIWG